MDLVSKSFRGYVGYSSMVMAQRLRELGGRGSVLRRDVNHLIGERAGKHPGLGRIEDAKT